VKEYVGSAAPGVYDLSLKAPHTEKGTDNLLVERNDLALASSLLGHDSDLARIGQAVRLLISSVLLLA
jgi:hypothetical protein